MCRDGTARTMMRAFNLSRRCLSTALCDARRAAVLSRAFSLVTSSAGLLDTDGVDKFSVSTGKRDNEGNRQAGRAMMGKEDASKDREVDILTE